MAEVRWMEVDEVPEVPGEQVVRALHSNVQRPSHYPQIARMESPTLPKTANGPVETIAAALDDALFLVQVKSPAVAEAMQKVQANSKAHGWY
jgi:hypothetical protein